MVLLLTLLLLFYQADDLPAAKLPAVDFSAVRQGKVEHDQGCLPLYSRQIAFRVKNRSDRTLYIHGLKTDGYHPFGYLIRLEGEKNQWLNPEGVAAHRPFKELMTPVRGLYVPDVYVLPPGKSMKFNDLAKEIYLGSRVKRVIFISFSRDEEPQLFTSEEFTLR